ncbi:MAG: hypothetical protein MUE65_00045 [Methanomassiliicoccales archaeon]|jgi:uncharacterized membrane protein|nr:hypothetical protein [Methanomassiliicoccales archaeon]
MVEFGPIQLIVLGFPDETKLQGQMLKEIFKLSEAKIIRVIGLTGIIKDKKGNIAAAQLSELSDAERIKLGAGIGALIGLGAGGKDGAMLGAIAGAETAAENEFALSKEDVMRIANDIPKGTAAGILLIEHLWAKKLKEISIKQNGVVLAQGFIQPIELVALGAELAAGARAAEKIKL